MYNILTNTYVIEVFPDQCNNAVGILVDPNIYHTSTVMVLSIWSTGNIVISHGLFHIIFILNLTETFSWFKFEILSQIIWKEKQINRIKYTLKGYCTPNQKLARFVLNLKIINTFLKTIICISKQIVQGTQKWHWNFSRLSGLSYRSKQSKCCFDQ